MASAQSSKVTTVGRPTAGGLDYGSVRSLPLPSGERTLRFGTARRDWPEGFTVDAAGIAPAVRVPAGVTDWSAFALGVIVGRDTEYSVTRPQ